jgi:acetoacetate decarboxylase
LAADARYGDGLKKLGRIETVEQDPVVQTTVERGGIQLLREAVTLSELIEPEELGGTTEDVKNGAPPDVSQLTLTELTNFVPHRVYRGPATLEFFASPQDHYANIPIREVVEGFYYSSDFTLEDGEVIHDFLK